MDSSIEQYGGRGGQAIAWYVCTRRFLGCYGDFTFDPEVMAAEYPTIGQDAGSFGCRLGQAPEGASSA